MSDTVQEARADLEAAMSWLTTDESPRVDALIAAVRAEERARCIAVVERVPCERASQLSGAMIQRNPASVKRDILAALTGADK